MSKELMSILLLISALVLLAVGCTKPLNIYSTTPTNHSTVNTERIEVSGVVTDSKATVWVNDTKVAVTKARTGGRGNFAAEIDLVEGPNTINIVAARGIEGNWKDVVSKTVTVTYSP